MFLSLSLRFPGIGSEKKYFSFFHFVRSLSQSDSFSSSDDKKGGGDEKTERKEEEEAAAEIESRPQPVDERRKTQKEFTFLLSFYGKTKQRMGREP